MNVDQLKTIRDFTLIVKAIYQNRVWYALNFIQFYDGR